MLDKEGNPRGREDVQAPRWIQKTAASRKGGWDGDPASPSMGGKDHTHEREAGFM